MKHASTLEDMKYSKSLQIVSHLTTSMSLNRKDIEEVFKFPYKLDEFQENAILAIRDNKNVLVTAHTSAGKSTVAEYTIAHAMRENKRVFYTSPIKALSNQKFGDFKKKFGKDVGILTGDIKVRPEAPLIVATTEIVNNFLYTNPDMFENVYAIILDEVHYIRDDERGHVWEEVITLCPEDVRLVMLSASIPGAQEFAKWVSCIKNKPCELVSTLYRPVPLSHYVHWGGESLKIMDNLGNMNEAHYRTLRENWVTYQKKHVREKSSRSKLLNEFLDNLEKQEYFPALFFMFSRKQCETLAKMVQKTYITGKQATESIHLFEYYVKKFLGERGLQHAQVNTLKSLISKGVGVHHSGLLPILKEILEILFEKGWIRIMFVTETFSVGINMPTKCVVFGQLSKFDGKEKRFVNPEEYCQMSGRAGRRGKDTEGIVIYFPLPPYEMLSYYEIKDVFHGKHSGISSKFKMDPVILLRCFCLNRSPYDVLKSSLMAHESTQYSKGITIQLKNLTTQHTILQGQLQNTDDYITHNETFRQITRYDDQISLSGLRANSMKTITKKKQKLISSLPCNFKEDMEKIIRIEKEITKFKNELNELETFVETTVMWQMEILQKKNYLDNTSDIKKQLFDDFFKKKIDVLPPFCVTLRGRIAACFHECDAFIATEFLLDATHKFQDDEWDNTQELVKIWSILLGHFIEDTTFDENSIEYHSFISQNVHKDTSIQLKKYVETLKTSFSRLQNENCVQNENFELSPLHGCVTYLWITGESFENIQTIMGCEMYDGNFVRNMLKIYNICEEFESALDILQNHKLKIIVSQLQTQLIRDIVVCDSLYVAT